MYKILKKLFNGEVKFIIMFLMWTLIGGLSLYFFLDNVVAYFFGYRSAIFGTTLMRNQLWVIAHMAGGSLTLLLGPFQFVRRLRFTQYHKVAGKLYLGGLFLACLAAFRLSLISTCFPCRISLLLLSLFASVSGVFAWTTIRRGDHRNHRMFVIRSYICVLAFVAVRVDDVVSLNLLFGETDDPMMRRVMNEYFFSFVPLIIGEILMTWIPAGSDSKPKYIKS